MNNHMHAISGDKAELLRNILFTRELRIKLEDENAEDAILKTGITDDCICYSLSSVHTVTSKDDNLISYQNKL